MKKLLAGLMALGFILLVGCGEKDLSMDEAQRVEMDDSEGHWVPNRVQPIETFGAMPVKYRFGIETSPYETGVYTQGGYHARFAVKTDNYEVITLDMICAVTALLMIPVLFLRCRQGTMG